jgi:predicted RNA-binding protein YlxR (DUF448 family)
MSGSRHIPLRTCTGCGQRAPQRDLVRFVSAAGGGLRLDPERRLPGRGAYLHPTPSCCAAFAQRKPPLRSLRRSVDRRLRAALIEQLCDPS